MKAEIVARWEPCLASTPYNTTTCKMFKCDGGAWVAASDYESLEAELSRAKAAILEWVPVSERLPACDGERVFVGINTAGFAACFNHINPDGVCVMGGPESSTAQMSELAFWYELDYPAASSEQWRAIQRRHAAPPGPPPAQ